jgi:hypothetical protein
LNERKDLIQQSNKVKQLERELSTPLNVHRWRQLGGTDPEKGDLLMQVSKLRSDINCCAFYDFTESPRVAIALTFLPDDAKLQNLRYFDCTLQRQFDLNKSFDQVITKSQVILKSILIFKKKKP